MLKGLVSVTRVVAFVAALLMLAGGFAAQAPAASVDPRSWRVERWNDIPCVEERILAVVDPNHDGILTLAELWDYVAAHPESTALRELVQRAEDQGITGLRYEGCGLDTDTDTETDIDTGTDTDTEPPGEFPCFDEPSLAGVDPNRDGVLTLKELHAIAAAHPKNEMLGDLVQQAEKQGIDGIRYRDCG